MSYKHVPGLLVSVFASLVGCVSEPAPVPMPESDLKVDWVASLDVPFDSEVIGMALGDSAVYLGFTSGPDPERYSGFASTAPGDWTSHVLVLTTAGQQSKVFSFGDAGSLVFADLALSGRRLMPVGRLGGSMDEAEGRWFTPDSTFVAARPAAAVVGTVGLDGRATAARLIEATYGSNADAIAAMPSGDVVVAGVYGETLVEGTLSVPLRNAAESPGRANMRFGTLVSSTHAYVARLDSSLADEWAVEFTSESDSALIFVSAVDTSPGGDVCVAATVDVRGATSHVQSGAASAEIRPGTNGVVVRLSERGNVEWIETIRPAGAPPRFEGANTESSAELFAVAATDNGGCVVGGVGKGRLQVGETTFDGPSAVLTSPGGGLVVALGPDGAFERVVTSTAAPREGRDAPGGVARVHALGVRGDTLLVGGMYDQGGSFGGAPLAPSSSFRWSAFVAVSVPRREWVVLSSGGEASTSIDAVAIADGGYYVGGRVWGDASLGGHAIESRAPRLLFVSRLSFPPAGR